jgi:hypothetical protein
MKWDNRAEWPVASLMALTCATLVVPSAKAVSLNGLEGVGVEHIYGNYAPGADCAREPRVMIDDAGFTFRANGRTVNATRIEYAASFFGGAYEGISLAFFPFPRDDGEPGPVLMYVNEDEVPGVLRIETWTEQRTRPDAFHAALAGRYRLCSGSGIGVPPPRPAEPDVISWVPLEWENLRSMVGRYPGNYAEENIDIFDKGAIAAALRSVLGEKMSVLQANLSVVGPLQRQGALYYLLGNAPHRGGEDQAYVLMHAGQRVVQVGLWERGKLTVYAPTGGRLREPLEIRDLLARSPGETANAAPGKPWEVLPVGGRSPIAYVEAAASPNINSISLYCEGGRPFLAMLLNKPANGSRSTLTWNFAGRLSNVPVQRANNEGTYWVGSIAGTSLIEHLLTQPDVVDLRIDGRLEGEASLENAPGTIRATMRQCVNV